MHTEAFDFGYQPPSIHYGRGRLGELDGLLAELGCERALVVCGRNVGANRALMDPLEDGLGERHADTFAATTPDKRLATAHAAATRADEVDADVLVPVGGGSSLDVATVAAGIRGRSLADVRRSVAETGGISPPADHTPLVPVPTTLAGADLSPIAGITVELPDESAWAGDTSAADDPATDDGAGGGGEEPVISTGVGGVEPTAVVYDPAAVETTPRGPLTGSAMNGFDKAIESLYAATATPVTDATATRAVEYLVPGLSALLAADGYDERAMDRAVAGVILAQYGVSRGETTTLNLLHALGHGLRDAFGLQQGIAHAVLAPHGVAALFDAGVDSEPLTTAFAVESGAAVVGEIERVRDALALPTRLRDLDGVTRARIDEAAAITAADSLAATVPEPFTLTEATAREIIEAAW